jgi:hypothetical protein
MSEDHMGRRRQAVWSFLGVTGFLDVRVNRRMNKIQRQDICSCPRKVQTDKTKTLSPVDTGQHYVPRESCVDPVRYLLTKNEQ